MNGFGFQYDGPGEVADSPPESDGHSALTDIERIRLRRLVREKMTREMEPTNLYEPLPNQLAFHQSQAKERLLRGSNRAGKAQPIWELVLTPNGFVPIGELQVGDVVIGGDGNPCMVSGVFPQGEKEIYRLVFDDDAEVRCCGEHLWKVQCGSRRYSKPDEWQVLPLNHIIEKCGYKPDAGRGKKARIPKCVSWMPKRTTPIEPYLMGVLLGDGTLRPGGPSLSCADTEMIDAIKPTVEAMGARLLKVSQYDYRISGGDNGIRNAIKDAMTSIGLWGLYSHEKFIPSDYLFNDVDSRIALIQGLMDTDGTIAKAGGKGGQSIEFSTTSPLLADGFASLVRSVGGHAKTSWRITNYNNKHGEKTVANYPSATVRISLPGVCPFRLSRKRNRWLEGTFSGERRVPKETRLLNSVEPDGKAECVCISVTSPDQTYVTRDFIVTHNTIASAMEIAWAVSNRHPYIDYPKEGRIIAVGNSEGHIGNVMWHKLVKTQYKMRILRDLETGQWRAMRPWEEADKARLSESRPMPPLIPPRLIAEEPSWKKKKEGIPSRVLFKTGWELLFFTGGGNPPHGIDVDLVWFDEEIEQYSWYPEMAARLLDRGGRFFWSATAQEGGDALWNLHLRAMDEEGAPKPSVTEHPILLNDNPYMSQEDKDELAEKYKHDPDAYRVRILGEYLITSFHIYPTFSITRHCCEPFVVPDNWCRYMIVDPGTVVAAVLFVAVPPDQSHMYVYDELYQRDSHPQKWAEAIRHKTMGQIFQSFIIDDAGSRRTDASSGTTVRQVYADLLKNMDIHSRATNHSFELGQSNVQAGLDQVRKFLEPKPKSKDTKPYIQIFMPGCPNLVEEFPRYHKKRSKTTGVITEEPQQKHNHALDCLRYAVMHGCRYVKPEPIKRRSKAGKYMESLRKKDAKKRGGKSIIIG